MRCSDGQVGKVGRIAKVSYRSRDADEHFLVPGRDHEIGVGDHLPHSFAVVHGTPFTQCGRAVEFDDLIEVELIGDLVANGIDDLL